MVVRVASGDPASMDQRTGLEQADMAWTTGQQVRTGEPRTLVLDQTVRRPKTPGERDRPTFNVEPASATARRRTSMHPAPHICAPGRPHRCDHRPESSFPVVDRAETPDLSLPVSKNGLLLNGRQEASSTTDPGS